jgi:hypothetical protein
LKGIGSGLNEVLCRNLPAGIEENHDEPQSGIAGVPAEIRTEHFSSTSLRASALTPTSSLKSPRREASSHSTGQEIPHLYWRKKKYFTPLGSELRFFGCRARSLDMVSHAGSVR